MELVSKIPRKVSYKEKKEYMLKVGRSAYGILDKKISDGNKEEHNQREIKK